MKKPAKPKPVSVFDDFPLVPGLRSLRAMMVEAEIAREEAERRAAKARRSRRPRIIASKLLRSLRERVDAIEKRLAALESTRGGR